MSDPEIWLRLAEHWQRNGCAASPGVSASAIAEFEHRYQVVMPAGVRAYFQAMDGQCPEMGSDLFRFWPLSEVKLVSEELGDIHSQRLSFPNCFVFVDYLIWSWAYAVEMGNSPDLPGAVYRIDDGENSQVCTSFMEFIRAYVADPESIAF